MKMLYVSLLRGLSVSYLRIMVRPVALTATAESGIKPAKRYRTKAKRISRAAFD